MVANNNTRLFLEVDADQISVTQLLKKDFLELSMRAISTANPNRNGSWFTKESMERSLGTFVNKPILGYFKQGDFVSHNGEWKVDGETDLPYFDTWDTEGERILGIIRESDERKIIQGADGLYWITFTCALWSQYNFKQVKRLIKDARRAKRTGEAAKNISVEVDITDYEMLENGVMKINAFELIGVTILGSRNGVKVEPGIENAELSVVDIMGRELYDKQVKALRLAYEKLENSTEVKEEKNMEEVLNSVAEFEQTHAGEPSVSEASDSSKESFEDVCSVCGKTPCECKTAELAVGDCDEREDECGGKCAAVCPDCGKDPCECEAKCEEESGDCTTEECGTTEPVTECHEAEPVREENSCDCECECEHTPIQDITWLMSSFGWQDGDIAATLEYYENTSEEIPNREYIVNVLKRSLNSVRAIMADLADLAAVVAEGNVSDDKMAYEAKMQEYPDHYELIKQYEDVLSAKSALAASLEEATAQIARYEYATFIASAKKLIASAKLSAETSAEFIKKCEDYKEISSIEDLKAKVAMSLLEQNMSEAAEETSDEKEESVEFSFNAPVSSPDTTSVFSKKEETKKVSSNPWDQLRNYTGK